MVEKKSLSMSNSTVSCHLGFLDSVNYLLAVLGSLFDAAAAVTLDSVSCSCFAFPQVTVGSEGQR